jgi:hypothetical protein
MNTGNTGNFWFDLTQILISKNFEKEIVFESSVLAWIRIEQKCWIRIRIKSIRIHNPAKIYAQYRKANICLEKLPLVPVQPHAGIPVRCLFAALRRGRGPWGRLLERQGKMLYVEPVSTSSFWEETASSQVRGGRRRQC